MLALLSRSFPTAIANCTSRNFATYSRLPAARIMGRRNETEEERAVRKQAKKTQKESRRLQRQGLTSPEFGQKPCTLCGRQRDLLIRCQVDETKRWHMVCGKCWMGASGGKVDGAPSQPHYCYGGLWKNQHKPITGRHKVPKAASNKPQLNAVTTDENDPSITADTAELAGQQQASHELSDSEGSSSDYSQAAGVVAGKGSSGLERLLRAEAESIVAAEC